MKSLIWAPKEEIIILALSKLTDIVLISHRFNQ